MMKLLQPYMKKPAIYSPSTAKFWDDPHISKGMLEAHLDPDTSEASRKPDFIMKSVRWIAETFPPAQYPALLDLGCDPGIYAEQFHVAGYWVTGVDLSERSIHYAQDSAAQNKLDIQYQRDNYLELSLHGEYDLITMIYCDFGALPDGDRAKLLRKIHGLLRPGGCFLFDVFSSAAYAGQEEYCDWEYKGRRRLLECGILFVPELPV